MDPRELHGVDLRTFTARITRQQFRELPLRWVLTPSLDAPVLVFKHEDQGRASVLSADLDTWREAYPKTSVPQSLKRIARAARDAHLRRVALAIGYTWPGNPPGYIEFAPDEITREGYSHGSSSGGISRRQPETARDGLHGGEGTGGRSSGPLPL